MARAHTHLHKTYIALVLTLGAMAGTMWAAGMQGDRLLIAGLVGFTCTAAAHGVRIGQRNRRMALALKTAVSRGVIAGECAGAADAPKPAGQF